jgi:hypothetical protein
MCIRDSNYIGTETEEWKIEGSVIMCDYAAPLKLRYIASIEDPNLWDINFREALASRIAMELAEDLTQSDTKKQSAASDYQRAIRQAVRSNAIERLPATPPDDQWVISRI